VRLAAISDCIDHDALLEASTFSITLRRGNAIVETHVLRPGNAQPSFFGVWTVEPFDQVEIREIEGGSDTELFGRFFIGAPMRTPGCEQHFSGSGTSCDAFISCES
jgi:hypothetical protein